jgi:hypothetical protein
MRDLKREEEKGIRKLRFNVLCINRGKKISGGKWERNFEFSLKFGGFSRR